MNKRPKWMVTLKDPKEYAELKSMANETKINGSEVLAEAFRRAKKDPEFKKSLIEAQARLKRRELEDKKATIEAELRKLEALTSGDEVQ